MSSRTQRAFFATFLMLAVLGSAEAQPPQEKRKDADAPNAARIDKLIRQLGSGQFAERAAATKKLEAIGEPILEALKKAAKSSNDLETRRRIERLADRIETSVREKLVKDGVQQRDTFPIRNLTARVSRGAA